MQKILLLAVSLYASYCFAQPSLKLVAAEEAFAAVAIKESIKDAFLKNMDSTAVVFDRGNIYNGFDYWAQNPAGDGKLLWHPSFFAMASSGDLGFTTGPFEVRQTMEDTAVSCGQYSTVWTKNKQGEWKFLVDLGVYYRPNQYKKQPLKEFTAFMPAPATVDILAIEQQFIEDYKKDGINVFRKYLLDESWVNMNRITPLLQPETILTELSKLPSFQFTIAGGRISAAKDMGYIYGTVTYEQKKENYMRIWVYTKDGWKILLQVLKR